jgi:hypothetical protein
LVYYPSEVLTPGVKAGINDPGYSSGWSRPAPTETHRLPRARKSTGDTVMTKVNKTGINDPGYKKIKWVNLRAHHGI